MQYFDITNTQPTTLEEIKILCKHIEAGTSEQYLASEGSGKFQPLELSKAEVASMGN